MYSEKMKQEPFKSGITHSRSSCLNFESRYIATLDAFGHTGLRTLALNRSFLGFVQFNATLTKNTGTDSVCTEFPWYFLNTINLEVGRKC